MSEDRESGKCVRAGNKGYVPEEVKFFKKLTRLTPDRYWFILPAAKIGVEWAREELIEGWLPLASSIASTWAGRFTRKNIDLYLEAGLRICTAVDRVIKADPPFDFDHASRYIHTRINGALILLIRQDFLIRPPKYSKEFEAEIKEKGFEWVIQRCSPESMSAVITSELASDFKDDSKDPIIGQYGYVNNEVEYSDMWLFADLENSEVFTPNELTIIQMRMAHYTLMDIARQIGCTHPTILNRIKNMEPRILRYLAGRY